MGGISCTCIPAAIVRSMHAWTNEQSNRCLDSSCYKGIIIMAPLPGEAQARGYNVIPVACHALDECVQGPNCGLSCWGEKVEHLRGGTHERQASKYRPAEDSKRWVLARASESGGTRSAGYCLQLLGQAGRPGQRRVAATTTRRCGALQAGGCKQQTANALLQWHAWLWADISHS